MKKYITLAICASLFALSCENKEETIDETPSEVKMITVSCTLPDSDDDSKVTLSTAGKIAWVAGDEVLFHGAKVGNDGETYYSYVASAHNVSEDGKTASFTIPDLADKYSSSGSYISSIFAIYPADAVYPFSSGATWNYVSAFNNTNQLLLAGYNNPNFSSPDPNVFKFINLTGALSFKVSGDFDSYMVEGNNGEVLGWNKYSITAAACTSWYEERTCYRSDSGPGGSSGPISSLHVTPTNPSWNDGEFVNTVYFPGTGNGTDLDGDEIVWNEAANFTNGFTIKFYSGSTEVKRVRTSTAKNIQIGTLLDLGNITSHLINPPAHEPASWTEGAENLSASGTANCYVVYHKDVPNFSGNAGKAFVIDAVKGNSATSVGTVASVELLWETYNNSSSVEVNTVIADVDYDSSHIYFKMPSSGKMHTGNALIAAKDAFGTILWSWHIWVPSSEIAPYGDISVSSKYWMDRNLGAITGVAGNNGVNYGLLYQWGRPHPRVGLNGSGGTTYAKTYPTNAIVAQNISDGGKTMEDAIQNPTVFYVNNHCWYNDASVSEEYWSTTKTIYDPCPAGWMVPAHGILNTSNMVEDTDNGGVSISGLYFPATGGASRYTGAWPEGNSFYWSCDTYVGSNKQRAYWYMFKDAGPNGFGDYEYKTTSAPIRCVKIEGEVPIFTEEQKALAEDKSANESANCYVVRADDNSNKSKIFKFRAVKGNSYVKDSSAGESLATAATATVLWETWNSSSAGVSTRSVIDRVLYDGGYVYFAMPSTLNAGNALIAVKDSEGTILWSWHIWVPGSSINDIDEGFAATEKKIMDRNLGALFVATTSATPDYNTHGLYYQWGRKDPFYSDRIYGAPSGALSHEDVSSTSGTTTANTISHPTVLYRRSGNNWNSSNIATLWENSGKTVYDPCPAGYRVPVYNSECALWVKNQTNWTFDTTNKYAKHNSYASVFPMPGYLNSSLWPSDDGSGREIVWSANDNASYKGKSAYFYLDKDSKYYDTVNYKTLGGSVRCVEE